MNTRKFKKVTVLLIAVLMIAGTNLYAQKGKNYSKQERGFNHQTCQMIPNLTEDQQKQIDALKLNHMKEMNIFRNQMNELRAKKHTLMTSDNSDMKGINAIIDQMTDVQNKMMKATAKHKREVRSLLTDEQKVYFDSKPMHGHGQGMGMRDGRGNGRGNGSGQGQGRGQHPDCPYNNN